LSIPVYRFCQEKVDFCVGFLQHSECGGFTTHNIIEYYLDIIGYYLNIIGYYLDIIKYNSQESDLNPHTDLLKMLP